MKWLLLFMGILTNSIASVSIKLASAKQMQLRDPIHLLLNWRLIVSLGFYCAAFLFYSIALSRMPLNIAQPVMTAGAIVLVGLASAFLFRESFSTLQTAGYAFLVVGIVLISAPSGMKG